MWLVKRTRPIAFMMAMLATSYGLLSSPGFQSLYTLVKISTGVF